MPCRFVLLLTCTTWLSLAQGIVGAGTEALPLRANETQAIPIAQANLLAVNRSNPTPSAEPSRWQWVALAGLAGVSSSFLGRLAMRCADRRILAPRPQTPQADDSIAAPLPDQDSSNGGNGQRLQQTTLLEQSGDDRGEPSGGRETTRLAKINISEELIRDLYSPDPTRRRKAIWELGQRGDSQAVQPLVDLMIDSDSNQRSLILAAISEIGVRTLKPMHRALLISLQDESSEVRKNAIRDLTRIYDLVTQVSQLLGYAVNDSDAEVQETAQWALGQLNRIRPRDTLPKLTPDCLPNDLPNDLGIEQSQSSSSS